jgi:hypothetical protein
LRALLLTAGCAALWGCTSKVQVQDLAIEKLGVADSGEWFSPGEINPRRNLLRVDLTTKTDLVNAARQWNMHIGGDAAFCSHPDDSVLLGGLALVTSTPYDGEFPRTVYESDPVEHSDAADKHTYYLLLNIAVPADPFRVGFDLVHPRGHMHLSQRCGHGGVAAAALPPAVKYRTPLQRHD